MRLLADENFPRAAVEALRTAGHDVAWAQLDMPSEVDYAILVRAQQESRIILTLDKGFGRLAIDERLPGRYGVIVVRLSSQVPEYLANYVVQLLRSRDDWYGRLATVTEGRLRIRPLLSITDQADSD